MFSFTHSGSFKNTEQYLRNLQKFNIMPTLQRYAQEGVEALSRATPRESGLASRSWGYKVFRKGNTYGIDWTNNDVESGFPVVIRLQYGYATGTGGFVQGQDFINPAIKPVFDKIANEVWKVVTK